MKQKTKRAWLILAIFVVSCWSLAAATILIHERHIQIERSVVK